MRSGGTQGSRGQTLQAFPSPGPGVASSPCSSLAMFGLPPVMPLLLLHPTRVGSPLWLGAVAAAASLPLGPGLRKSGARQLLVSPHSQGQCGQSPLIVRDGVLARETLTCSFQLVLLVDSVSPLHRSSVFRAKACFPPGILSQLDDLRIGRWFVC